MLSGQTGDYPDFASIVYSWYTDPVWQNMLLFPWMDEEALLLSEAHSDMEMVSIVGRYRRKTMVPLNHYMDLFADLKKEGTRILLKGDPGTGKTTFVHKLAFDSATGKLDLFDVIFVVKLKFADKNHSIGEIIKEQIKSIYENDDVTTELIEKYLKSGRDRVLLILDGIDEITLKDHQPVKDVLEGKALRKCCILATTRPYVAENLNNKMTMIANITGFSRTKAEQFISHLLIAEEERKTFFQQLEDRKMSDMYKIPMLVQALALLFREEEELPATFTLTYDQLVFFLRKTCEDSKELSEDELKAAMDEVNHLAFRGLTRKDKQLVFSRDEVQNPNSYKLGVLTAEKGGSGFRPTTVLQFLHKTFQENSVADHVVNGLLSNDRESWETMMRLIRAEVQETKPQRRRSAGSSNNDNSDDTAQETEPEIQTNNKTFLKFFVGKLFQKLFQNEASADFILSVLIEVADLLLELYREQNIDEISNFEVVTNFMEDLLRESGHKEQTGDIVTAVLEHLYGEYHKIMGTSSQGSAYMS